MKTHTSIKSKINSAFSLVELLVVIAVIAVIAAIAIPNITGVRDAAVGAQTKADGVTKTNLLNQIMAVGAKDSNGNVPDDITDLTNASGSVTFTNAINGTNVSFKLQ